MLLKTDVTGVYIIVPTVPTVTPQKGVRVRVRVSPFNLFTCDFVRLLLIKIVSLYRSLTVL